MIDELLNVQNAFHDLIKQVERDQDSTHWNQLLEEYHSIQNELFGLRLDSMLSTELAESNRVLLSIQQLNHHLIELIQPYYKQVCYELRNFKKGQMMMVAYNQNAS